MSDNRMPIELQELLVKSVDEAIEHTEGEKMDLSKKRCGSCGEKAFEYQNVKGTTRSTWKRFKDIVITRDLDLWVCQNCGERGMTRGDAKRSDEIMEASLKDVGRL